MPLKPGTLSTVVFERLGLKMLSLIDFYGLLLDSLCSLSQMRHINYIMVMTMASRFH